MFSDYVPFCVLDPLGLISQ